MSNLRLLGCFLLLYFGGVVLVLVLVFLVVLVVLVVLVLRVLTAACTCVAVQCLEGFYETQALTATSNRVCSECQEVCGLC